MIRNPVTLAPLSEDRLAEAQALTVKPFQVIFSGQPSEFVGFEDAGFSTHLVLKEGEVVGAFRLSSQFHFNHTFAQSDTPGMTNFVIDADRQGEGLGTEACRMMPAYLRGAAPRARGIYLTMNMRNQGGYKALTRGGWTDTGTEHALGASGPAHIFWMPLR